MSNKALFSDKRGGRARPKEFKCQFCGKVVKVRWGLGVEAARNIHEKQCGGRE